jgi:arylsulfatase
LLSSALVTGCGPSGGRDEPDPDARAAKLSASASESPLRLIVLISLDTLRADHLSLYGHERFTSPSLDTLALDGVVFDDASAVAPWTLPSHASMLTGLYPLKHRVTTMRSRLAEEFPTLATLLGAAGWETAAVVNSTWLRKDSFRLTAGFDRYLFVEDRPARRSPSTWVTDQALAWLRDRGDRPLFLFAHYYDVHADYASEPAYEKLFVTPNDGIADGTGWQIAQTNFEPEYIEMCKRKARTPGCTFGGKAKLRDVYDIEKPEFDEQDVLHVEQLYDAGIRQLDAELGRLFAGMRGDGILDEALIVVTGDHGEGFREHGYLDHFIPMYQEMLHVPLLFRGPGVPRGKRVSVPVSGVDIAPTLLGLAGVEAPEALDGLDLAPLFFLGEEGEEGEEGEGGEGGEGHDGAEQGEALAAFEERLLFGEASGGKSHDLNGLGDYFPNYRSLRRGPYKLIYEQRADVYSLYDLDADPGEQRDISEREPAIAQQLIAAMQERYESAAASQEPENEVELAPEEIERLRELGYML